MSKPKANPNWNWWKQHESQTLHFQMKREFQLHLHAAPNFKYKHSPCRPFMKQYRCKTFSIGGKFNSFTACTYNEWFILSSAGFTDTESPCKKNKHTRHDSIFSLLILMEQQKRKNIPLCDSNIPRWVDCVYFVVQTPFLCGPNGSVCQCGETGSTQMKLIACRYKVPEIKDMRGEKEALF